MLQKKYIQWIPLLLVIVVAASFFAFQNHKDGFETSELGYGHGFISAHGLALAKNLNTNGFPLFSYTAQNIKDGKIQYEAYNRFPFFVFYMMGQICKVFEGDFAKQIYANRQLMNVFIFLAMMVTYLLLSELGKSRSTAAGVCLIFFSSYYVLKYHDITKIYTPALLGFVVAFYAVVLEKSGKLGKGTMILFALFPVSMSWHPYAVFVSWCMIEFADEIFFRRDEPLGQRFFGFLRHPSFVVTLLAVVWGVVVLGFQLYIEWLVVGGRFMDIPSLVSMIHRIGMNDVGISLEYQQALAWKSFAIYQLYRIFLSLSPFSLVLTPRLSTHGWFAVLVISETVFLFSLWRFYVSGKLSTRQLKVLMVFLLSGFMWCIPMRHQTFARDHEFEGMYYVGAILAFYYVLSLFIKSRWVKRVFLGITFLMALFSVYRENVEKNQMAPEFNAYTAEFQNIVQLIPAQSKIYLSERGEYGMGLRAVDFYFSGGKYYFVPSAQEADYVLSIRPDYPGRRLTPSNKRFNIFAVK